MGAGQGEDFLLFLLLCQDDGEGCAAESAWPARRGYPGTEAAGRLQGTLAGVTVECPPQADPRAPAIASLPCAALGSFASKTKTNPIPPPCLPEEGERERRGG